jgi:hypothetical protein
MLARAKVRESVENSYGQFGHALVKGLVRPEVAKALLDSVWADIRDQKFPVSFGQSKGLVTKPAMELHGSRYPELTRFLWGMTSTAQVLTGCDLLPTYCFFRLYQKGDRLRVHSDRDACEHSMTLTLGYSDNLPWPIQIGHHMARREAYAEDFGAEPYTSVEMEVGDALLYRGIERRHGRVSPNPNGWSAHLFLHWVDANGPYRHLAFEELQSDAA